VEGDIVEEDGNIHNLKANCVRNMKQYEDAVMHGYCGSLVVIVTYCYWAGTWYVSLFLLISGLTFRSGLGLKLME
jgi:hypothetical protein